MFCFLPYSWLSSGKLLIHVGDNVDIYKRKRHESQGKSVFDIHMFSNVVYVPGSDVSHLSTEPPVVDLSLVNVSTFISPVSSIDHMLKAEILSSWKLHPEQSKLLQGVPPGIQYSLCTTKLQRVSA